MLDDSPKCTLTRRLPEDAFHRLREDRARFPERVVQMAAGRRRRPVLAGRDQLLIIAADHPARGALGAGDRPAAMESRLDLLDRLMTALARPGVDGLLATPDIVEDLLLLGALDDKLVIGSMNRGGVQGSVFEFDDRFTAYTADSIAGMGLDGGKMLCRIAPEDSATVATLERCGQAVSSLAGHSLMAMIEPFWSRHVGGSVKHDLSAAAMVRAISVVQALGTTSARTWLKIPVVADMERVMAATTLPTLLLGGDPGQAADEAFAAWGKALRLPGVRGLVVGRALLYPPGDDVAAAVDAAASLLHQAPLSNAAVLDQAPDAGERR
ncbi:5-keto-2-deoxy-D-gluconate-6 phosphate aldolase [form 2] [[Actinomadura] parvosata subsp. kistnae]|uniref:Cgl0159 family (beta/alpha)8-fold protein n=1 Tax=[Actinomadura] parvosata TaxID=1955412 RepID=UPI000D2ECFE7|nr:deoxyribose-phosphate aldolase [Nonomuraea sp. ATCC 55076]SPL88010.1 5-keto-2-deoxy-D-gluconate-6 phosphate aldolase [form 2] [Actinomadura parvosata subsp. kistnae]